MQFFTNLGRTLDDLIDQVLQTVLYRPTPVYTKKPVEPAVRGLPPEVTLTLGEESMPALFLKKKMSPAVSRLVDVTDDEALSAAIRKAGGKKCAGHSWKPHFSMMICEKCGMQMSPKFLKLKNKKGDT